MVDVNRKLTSTDSWLEQRSANQKRLSSDKEYTKKRIDAMSTPEAVAKSKASNKVRIDSMSKEERRVSYSRDRSPAQIQDHAAKIKGRKKIANLETKEVKMVQPDDIPVYIESGWFLWKDLSTETIHEIFGKRVAWNKGNRDVPIDS